MNTAVNTTDSTYAQVVRTLLETDDLPEFWD